MPANGEPRVSINAKLGLYFRRNNELKQTHFKKSLIYILMEYFCKTVKSRHLSILTDIRISLLREKLN